jgi:hypothetical protein
MNFGYAPAPSGNYARPLTNSITSGGITGMFTKFWGVLIVIFIFFVIIVIYYKSIGYYLDIGWTRIRDMIKKKDTVNVEVGENGLVGDLKPMDVPVPKFAEPSPLDAPPVPPMPAPDVRPPGMPGANGSDAPDGTFLSSLHIGGPKKEVFNVSKNIYTFADASAVCTALNSELASYEQVKEAYENGADWCNYGWTKGQMAVYPTQKETWNKLQKGSADYRDACGKPGVNGGYFDNPDLRFGVNCYGIKPPRNATDEMLESSVALPSSAEQIEYDKKVQKFREQLSTTTVLPFRRGQWTE